MSWADVERVCSHLQHLHPELRSRKGDKVVHLSLGPNRGDYKREDLDLSGAGLDRVCKRGIE